MSPSTPGSAVGIYYRAAHSALPAAIPIWLGGLDPENMEGSFVPSATFYLIQLSLASLNLNFSSHKMGFNN